MFIQVQPEQIQDHVTQINATVAEIQRHQDIINKTISNPGLRGAGQDWVRNIENAQMLSKELDQLGLGHTQLGQNALAVVDRHLQTDAAMAKRAQLT